MTIHQHFMAIVGSVLIIASCQDANENKDLNAVPDQQSVVDTIPTRSNTSPGRMGDTSGRRMRPDTVSGKVRTGDLKKKMEGNRSKTKHG